jgi:hypothetical protein
VVEVARTLIRQRPPAEAGRASWTLRQLAEALVPRVRIFEGLLPR